MKNRVLKTHILTIALLIILSLLISCKSKSLITQVTTAPDVHVTQVPVFSHNSGTYNPGELGLTITTEAGATIRYTKDGSDPKTSGTAIDASGPTNVVNLTINEHVVIKAFSYLTDHYDSDFLSGIATRNYTMAQAADPVITPGTMPGPTTQITQALVTITCPTLDPTTIRYTTDGSTPTHSSTLYTAPFVITESKTIKAIAYSDVAPQYVDSNVSTMAYNIKVATPTPSVACGTYYNDFTITLSTSTPGATIYYTIDGSTPTTGSNLYTGVPISVNGSITAGGVATIKLRAFKTNLVDSNVYTCTYTLKAADPVFTHATGGPFAKPINDEFLTTTTTGATIAFAFDADPITTPLGSGASPLNVDDIWWTTLVNAYAYKAGYQNSSVVNRSYTGSFAPDGIFIP